MGSAHPSTEAQLLGPAVRRCSGRSESCRGLPAGIAWAGACVGVSVGVSVCLCTGHVHLPCQWVCGFLSRYVGWRGVAQSPGCRLGSPGLPGVPTLPPQQTDATRLCQGPGRALSWVFSFRRGWFPFSYTRVLDSDGSDRLHMR